MSKIKRLSVHEIDEDPSLNKIITISVSLETDFQISKNEDNEAFMLHLSVEENKQSIRKYIYYMWRQRFPVKSEFKVEQRKTWENGRLHWLFPSINTF